MVDSTTLHEPIHRRHRAVAAVVCRGAIVHHSVDRLLGPLRIQRGPQTYLAIALGKSSRFALTSISGCIPIFSNSRERARTSTAIRARRCWGRFHMR